MREQMMHPDIFFVVRVEIKEGGSLVTAMFNGKKILTKKPVDLD